MKKALLARLKSGGFTMIELLVVISILGILAVIVLAAINPLEQINRGRDTAARSDAEQLLSAFERYNAFNGFFPWQEDANDVTNVALDMQIVNDGWLESGGVCTILERLSNSATVGCVGTQELKDAFVTRVNDNGGGALGTVEARGLYVYYEGASGDNAYVCFSPQSNAFRNEASIRCDGTNTMPTDLASATTVCVDTGTDNAAGEDGVDMICLP